MTDVLIIGAGAAGLAAARTLHDAGIAATVLEARDRLGGRAWTSYDLAAHPVELGAEFIHGENVATWSFIERYGLSAIDPSPYLNVRAWCEGRMLDQAAFLQAPNTLLAWRMHRLAEDRLREGKPDTDLLQAATEAPSFFDEPPTGQQRRLWASMVAMYHGAELDELGLGGLLEATYQGDGVKLQFRIVEGYSALWSRLAVGLDIRLSGPVESIEWNADGVRVSTAGGEFEAPRVIVTLPLALLQHQDVMFEPALPLDKQRAIAALGSGRQAKIVLKFDEAFWPDETSFVFTTLDSQVFWRPGIGREDEAPMLTAFIGASAVNAFESAGDEAPLMALRHLEEMFGVKLEHRFQDARFVNWPGDRWARMGYSFVPPGATGMRAVLATPLASSVFFAGEATNSIRPATVHGAIESGLRAAREIIEAG
jgi:monoamine oxidase